MSTFRFYATQITTGLIIGEVPITSGSFQRHLKGGSMNVRMTLQHLPDDVRRAVLSNTRPGFASLAVERDGVILGDWIIWRRSRPTAGGEITLIGNEYVSLLSKTVEEYLKFVQIDQLEIARQIASYAKTSAGVSMTVPVQASSGRLRDRIYLDYAGTATWRQRLDELSEVQGGFDFIIESTLDPTRSAMIRTFKTQYPYMGNDLPVDLEQGVGGRSGSILAFNMDEDGTKLQSEVSALGAVNPDKQFGDPRIFERYYASERGYRLPPGQPSVQHPLYGLLAGYPRYSSAIIRPSTSDAVESLQPTATALWEISQQAELPPTVTVRADGDLPLGAFGIGDRVNVKIEPSVNYPDGFERRVRILGWTFSPPSDGGIEAVDLEIADIPADSGGY